MVKTLKTPSLDQSFLNEIVEKNGEKRKKLWCGVMRGTWKR